MTEEWHSKFFKEWPDDDLITEINTKNDRIVIYETSGTISQPRFRKNKAAATPKDLDAPVILVVLHRKVAKPSKMSFGVTGGADYFASPFILSLTQEEASTTAGIQRAIVKQYQRVTTLGDELLDYSETEIRKASGSPIAADAPSSSRTSSSESAALSALADPSSDATVVPSTPNDSAMDVDEAPPSLESASITSSLTLTDSTSSLLPPPVPSTSTSTPESSTSSRGAMFSLQVSKRRGDPTTLPLGQSAFMADLEPLENRANIATTSTSASSRTVNEDYDMFSPPAQSVDGEKAEEEEPVDEKKEETQSAAPETETPTPLPQPLIRTGDYIVVDWDPSAAEYFFSSTASRWEEADEVVDPALAARKSLGKQKQTITLDQCLTEFTKEERLGEEDMWYCSACKDFKQATKKVEIWKAPDVLVFALKRFSSGRYTRDKIDDFVDFPLEGFDMEPFVEGDKVERRLAAEMGEGNAPAISEPDSLLYDLYAVSNHFGGLGGGHYTAYAKNPDTNKWYDFDDVSSFHFLSSLLFFSDEDPLS